MKIISTIAFCLALLSIGTAKISPFCTKERVLYERDLKLGGNPIYPDPSGGSGIEEVKISKPYGEYIHWQGILKMTLPPTGIEWQHPALKLEFVLDTSPAVLDRLAFQIGDRASSRPGSGVTSEIYNKGDQWFVYADRLDQNPKPLGYGRVAGRVTIIISDGTVTIDVDNDKHVFSSKYLFPQSAGEANDLLFGMNQVNDISSDILGRGLEYVTVSACDKRA